ncbi:unnamed protein product, partial [Leptidea sinapis]
MSEESSSESEIEACSSKFNPLKALYSDKPQIPVQDAPMFENIQQYENALKIKEILPVELGNLVKKREEEKVRRREEEERRLKEINEKRFAQYKAVMPVKREFKEKNVLTRIQRMQGPLGALKDCVDQRLRIKSVIVCGGKFHATSTIDLFEVKQERCKIA